VFQNGSSLLRNIFLGFFFFSSKPSEGALIFLLFLALEVEGFGFFPHDDIDSFLGF